MVPGGTEAVFHEPSRRVCLKPHYLPRNQGLPAAPRGRADMNENLAQTTSCREVSGAQIVQSIVERGIE